MLPYETGNSSTMSYDGVFVSNVSKLGTSRFYFETDCTLAMSLDGEQLSKEIRPGIGPQYFKIKRTSATY